MDVDVEPLGAEQADLVVLEVAVVAAPDRHAAALAEGVWIRPFRDLVYTMPPYIASDVEIATICAGITAAAVAG